jgi:hypothetical protein
VGGYGYVLADTVGFLPGEVIFEAGSEFTRESSTSYLMRVAGFAAARFISSDRFTDGQDAVEFLRGDWPLDAGWIKFAYLDSWDWPYANMDPRHLAEAVARYASLGLELTEDASARHHLDLAKEVESLAAPGAVIVFDDTWVDKNGKPDGKGRDAVPWLMDNGWSAFARHVDYWGTGGSGQNAFYIALKRNTR